MTLDRIRLRKICFDMAAQILQERRPIDVMEIQQLADEYFQIAADASVEEFIVGQDRDPNLVLQVVKYLGKRHAIPPVGQDTAWFSHMFECLVELVCPNSAMADEDDILFFKEIEHGMEMSRALYQDEG
jgi:hypothetical protein